jgi:hypothetical protein
MYVCKYVHLRYIYTKFQVFILKLFSSYNRHVVTLRYAKYCQTQKLHIYPDQLPYVTARI